ncbi:double-strand break repair protein mre11 [Plakobranchus ocellatus]|uniref:Double-strand break repair protein mre11 n=1 Tax=Plakobranchus ocellatus TaxID=259542 RepID=A0AAV3YFB2_9GAST|nr:double-strand break repair protein mre11 [Plakobranchus ocellatus]
MWDSFKYSIFFILPDPKALAQIRNIASDSATVEDMVSKLVTSEGCQLKLLSEKGMSEAVKEYVDKEEKEAITELVKYQLKKTQVHLQTRHTNEDQIDAEVVRFKEARKQKAGEEEEDVKAAMKVAQAKRESQSQNGVFDDNADSDESVGASDVSNTGHRRARGRGGRGSRGGRGRSRGAYNDSGRFFFN